MLEIQSLWGDTLLDVRYEESSAIAIPRGQLLIVREGALAYRMREVRMPKLISPPVLDRLDYRWINVLILAAFFHAALIVASALTPADERPRRRARAEERPIHRSALGSSEVEARDRPRGWRRGPCERQACERSCRAPWDAQPRRPP
jgi:hypothetical protein